MSHTVGSKKSPQTFVPPAKDEKLIHDFSKQEMCDYYMKHFAHGAPKDFLKIPGMIEQIALNLQSDLGINQKVLHFERNDFGFVFPHQSYSQFWWSQLSESEQRSLDIPIHSFFGEKDDRNTEDDLLEWEKLSNKRSDCFFHHYEGNHFFIHDDQNVVEFLSDLSNLLKARK